MTEQNKKDLSFDEFDEVHNNRNVTIEFDDVVDRALSRRGFLGGALAMSTASFILGAGAFGSSKAQAATNRFGFTPVEATTADTITLPEGYSWHPVATWGEPIFSDVPEFDHVTRGTAATQARAFGDNNDGMALFSKDGRHILAVNNEYTNRDILWEGGVPADADAILKGKNAHGISVVEIAQNDGKWSIVKDSEFNFRITPDTEMEITGPARGHDLLKTAADQTGTKSLGTWNNCGNGRTPWGTYLTCEENFNGYFSSSDKELELDPALKRYGINHDDWGYGWAQIDERFDVAKHPNEPNRAGYVVEIDPMDPTATPKKRSALGRFKHENAELVVADNGHVVVYLGDDERGEFLYRFVSEGKYDPNGDNSNLLENGKLYVAKFHDDLSGEWLELTPETTGMASQAEISIHTRQAASAVGATTMDRPEWVASNPNKAEVYCCLTNNKNRGVKPNAGGDPTPVNGPNPREANKYGQIVRWAPEGGDHTATGFGWNLFVLAGNPTVHEGPKAGSANVNAGNIFNSPDGLSFDSRGFLWIQTDGSYSNADDFAGMGNNQMLVGDTETGDIFRFMVGPKECEVTGATWSEDKKTMFVGIQHPGEKGDSVFPGGEGTLPRSCVIAITKDDGGLMG
ncbi:PhoX family phosphatase [Pseudovibrio sp. SPO723]|uniref:PhoX family protein n=1 Tax=Nesiotobacter zosterae TaxID=392721 RepID=UPI0029C12C6E|nr:PhoX family phosphatase [Pseudovibrio sp. SPO723]MDX5593985.1 PhoX family phosphatase [Pseudovibrio sp. SPO723]